MCASGRQSDRGGIEGLEHTWQAIEANGKWMEGKCRATNVSAIDVMVVKKYVSFRIFRYLMYTCTLLANTTYVKNANRHSECGYNALSRSRTPFPNGNLQRLAE